MSKLTSIDTMTTDSVKKLGKKSSELADTVHAIMDELGVTRLANCYLTVTECHTHGTQYQLHIDGHSGDLERSKIDNTQSVWLDYGDFGLPYSYPTLDCVLEFIDSINDINRAISVIKDSVNSALNTDVTISS